MKRKGYQFLTGSVRYHELKKDGKRSVAYHQGNALVKADEVFDLKNEFNSITYRRDCFDKIDKYKGENEWRMALYRGEKDTKAYTLDIGDLHDIVYWDRAEYLDSGIQTAVGKGMKSVGSSEPRFYGNIDRKDLWNKFFELGDYKASKLINMVFCPVLFTSGRNSFSPKGYQRRCQKTTSRTSSWVSFKGKSIGTRPPL